MIQIKLKYTRQRIEDPNLHIAWNDIVGDISGNTALQDALDNKQDVGDYATHNDLSTVEDSLQNIINQAKDDINGELDKKQDKGNYALQGDSYTKVESDERYMKVGDVPTDVYTKQETDTKLSNKLDATAYTPYDDVQIKQDIAKKADKSYVNTELAKKQDKGDYVDNQTYENQIAELKAQLRELEELIKDSGKIDDVYVNGKSVVTDKIANIDMYTKTEIDNMIASVSFTVTRDKNTINITSNTSYVKDGTLVMNTSRAREDNNILYFS
jgi:hypothetical protein